MRKRRKRFGTWKISNEFIRLECKCGRVLEVLYSGGDPDDDLDEHAVGWYTNTLNIALCPICVVVTQAKPYGFGDSIHGRKNE